MKPITIVAALTVAALTVSPAAAQTMPDQEAADALKELLAEEGGDDIPLAELSAKLNERIRQRAAAKAAMTPQQRAALLRRLYGLPIEEADEALLALHESPTIVHASRGIDVPFTIVPFDLDQPSAPIWHKGKRPEDTVLAKTQGVAIGQAAVTLQSGGTVSRDIILSKATWRTTDDPEPLYPSQGIVYCTTDLTPAARKQSHCLIDDDDDGTFDSVALARSDNASEVHAIKVIAAPATLTSKLSYTAVAEPEPSVDLKWSICGKDWDKPPYSVSLQSKKNKVRMSSYMLGSAFSSCTIATEATPAQPVEEGAIAVEMDSLILEIGTKKSGAKTRLLESINPELTYRLEGADAVPLYRGYAPLHISLAKAQQFDRQPYPFNGKIEMATDGVGIGKPVLSIGFDYGYVGELTQKVKIRTLLTGRSLDIGTKVFGFPAELSTVRTLNGRPVGGFGRSNPRVMNTQIVWCTPIRDEYTVTKKNPDSEAQHRYFDIQEIVWAASCLPQNSAGNHTIIKNQKPALAVRSLRFPADSSSNDGPPPVREIETADFGAPISRRVRVTKLSKDKMTLAIEVMFGDEVSSTSKRALKLNDDQRAIFRAAGGEFAIGARRGPDGKNLYFVEEIQPAEEGKDAFR